MENTRTKPIVLTVKCSPEYFARLDQWCLDHRTRNLSAAIRQILQDRMDADGTKQPPNQAE